MLQERTTNLCASRVCLFLLSALCGLHCVERGFAGSAVQRARSGFLAIEERLEEVRLRGRQGLRPHVHRLDVFLERFGFARVSLMVPLKIVSASAVS